MAKKHNAPASLGRASAGAINDALDEIQDSLASGDTGSAAALLEATIASVLDGPLDSAHTLVDRDQDYENDPGFTIEGGLEDELDIDRENKMPSYQGKDEGEEDAEHPIVKKLADRISDVIDAVEDEMGLGREFGGRKGTDDEDGDEDYFGEDDDDDDDDEDEKKNAKARRKGHPKGCQCKACKADRRAKSKDKDSDDDDYDEDEPNIFDGTLKEENDSLKDVFESKKSKKRGKKARGDEDPDRTDDDDVDKFEKPLDGDDEGDAAGDVTLEEIEKHRRRNKTAKSAKRGDKRRRKSDESLEDEMEVEREDRMPSFESDKDDYDGDDDMENVKTAKLAEKKYRKMFQSERAARLKAERRADKAERESKKAKAALVKIYRQTIAHQRLSELAEAGIKFSENRLDRVIAKLAFMAADEYEDYYSDLIEAKRTSASERKAKAHRGLFQMERPAGDNGGVSAENLRKLFSEYGQAKRGL